MFSLLAIPAWAWVTSALILVAAAAIIAVLLTWDKIRAWIKSKGGGGTANKRAAKPKTEKPAAKTAVKTAKPVADDAAATTAATTTAEKPKTAKPAPAKPAAKPAPAEKPAPAKPAAKTSGKVYHITKRKEDGKWQIKAEGAEKAIKLFKTQKEAIEYCKTLAGNQDASIMVHKEDGSFRKV